jgi:serine/threonine-protein kinase
VPTLVAGQIVEEKYKVVRALAAGGFGAVYEVFREGLKQRGAMKVLTLNPSPEMVQRIHNEARVLGALRHPNIPQIYDMGSFPDGAPWLVMEFLEGESLEARLIRAHKSGQRGLPFADVMEIGEDITAAMNAAHEKGVIHRDMKPSNVVLVADAKAACGLRAVVLDFGIARMAGDGLTQTGALLGTPAYMAPEQAVDARQADAQSDVYAVGMVLYQSLCGRPPFDIDPARGPYGVLLAKAMPPEPLAHYAPHVPAEIQTLIMRTLERDPAQRPSMGDLEEALGRYRPPRRTGKTSSTHVVTVSPPTRPRPQSDDEEDPTASVSEAVVPLPSLSASLLQSETPSEQRVRGEISPGRDAPPVLVPQSISDVPSRPTVLPPLKASPNDRTAQPAPTQGVPVALAPPHALTAAPPPLAVNGSGAVRQAPTSLQWLFVFVGAVGALGLAATLAVLLWPKASPLGAAPAAPQTPPALQTLTGTGLTVAVPAQKAATSSPEMRPEARPDKPTDKAPEMVIEKQTASTADRPPDKVSDRAGDKGSDKPKASHRCSATTPTRSCIHGRGLSSENIDKVAQALRDSRVRLCPSEQLIIAATSRGFRISEAPERVSRGIRDDLVLTLGGLLVDIPVKMGEIVILCEGAP